LNTIIEEIGEETMHRRPGNTGIWLTVGSTMIGLTLLICAAWAAFAAQIDSDPADMVEVDHSGVLGSQAIAPSDLTTETIYLPSIQRNYDSSWIAPWGVEVDGSGFSMLSKATDADIRWLRLRLEWASVQPTQGTFQWDTYDKIMDQVKASGMEPIVVIHDNPEWADKDGNRCGPLTATSHLTDFLTSLVERYGPGTVYSVRYWQIGNEVDHSYNTWLSNYYPSGHIGCWGDHDKGEIDEYITYLATAWNAIKTKDPDATVMLGSLTMVDSTNTEFLDQFLTAGGGPYFDAASVHFYSGQDNADYTCADPPACTVKGLKGKVTILQNVMAKHGVDRPLMITELAGRCLHDAPDVEPCTSQELETQARQAVTYNIEAMSVDATPVIWFTLNYPGFYHSSLLDQNDDPKPAHVAYQMLTSELYGGRFVRQMSASEVGSNVEGYVISTGGGTREKYVLWRTSSGTGTVPFHLNAIKAVIRNDMTIETTIIHDGQAGDQDGRAGYIGVAVGESPVIVSQYP
jgi:hypothetical protein